MKLALRSPAHPGDDADRPMGEMNTTPLIDVMLVLLIMFIITIPVQNHSVGVDLPMDGGSSAPNPVKNKVTIDANDITYWNGTAVDRLTLRRYLARSLAMPVEPELQFQPAAEARYVTVDEVLADIRRAGVTRMGFIGNEQYGRF